MPVDHLALSSASAFGGEVIQAIRQVQQAHENFSRVFAKMTHMQDGSDYVVLETATGLPNGQGLGAALFAEANSIQGKINAGDPGTVVKAAVDQGAARFG